MSTAYITLEQAQSLRGSQHQIEQAALKLLKERGAPVIGSLNLRFDPDYTVTASVDIRTQAYVYSWISNDQTPKAITKKILEKIMVYT